MKELKKPDVKKEVTVYENNVDEDFLLNLEDSEKIYRFDDIRIICEEFIEESLILDVPLIPKHHLGYKDFTEEILHLFEENVHTIITELETFLEDVDDISDLDELIIEEMSSSKYY
tara:strand:- start:1667 stop:2014 length:348 start_codon:yes stop_codon:yes gene_type:complete